jgi:DNA-binding response OmpR family regulator
MSAPARQTILLVDDTPVIIKMLSKQLEHWGYRVLAAASGEEGLQRAEADQPDLILLDILMPKMKGRDVCKRLKANPSTKRIPVIFLTSLGLGEYVRAGLDVGGDDYVIKPFRPTYLRERIKVCLLRAQQGQPSNGT